MPPLPSLHLPARTDRELLGEIAAGDRDALTALYERHGARAQAVAQRITADHAIAEDVVQESFVQVWRNAGRYTESLSSVQTWLLGIVHHRAVDAVRRRRPADALPDADAAAPIALTAPDLWPEVSRRLDGVAIRRALEGLSPAQHEVIELAYFRGLSQSEIAAHTSTPLGTVKWRTREALRTLRRLLVGEVGFIEPTGGAA